jgi:hypothetical protein
LWLSPSRSRKTPREAHLLPSPPNERDEQDRRKAAVGAGA